MRTFHALLFLLLCSLAVTNLYGAEWKIAEHPLVTKWAAKVDPTNPLSEYPRLQMVRSEWKSLNGLWDYKVRTAGLQKVNQPEMDGQILVPFPIESALSGVKKPVGPKQTLWYRRTFKIPQEWKGKRILGERSGPLLF